MSKVAKPKPLIFKEIQMEKKIAALDAMGHARGMLKLHWMESAQGGAMPFLP